MGMQSGAEYAQFIKGPSQKLSVELQNLGHPRNNNWTADWAGIFIDSSGRNKPVQLSPRRSNSETCALLAGRLSQSWERKCHGLKDTRGTLEKALRSGKKLNEEL